MTFLPSCKRAAIYARISKKDKKAPKIENQISICQGLADDHGYLLDPKDIYVDDGIAASGKAIDDTTLENRPGAQRLLEAIRSGDIDVLLVVEGERLARTYLDGLEFIRASAAGGVIWHLDTDGMLDPSTPAGEETAVSIFAQGRREGRTRDARQKRRYDRERAQGMPLWGTRPFGYEADRITIREREAALIREAVTDYLAGRRSMLRIAKDWNAAGIKTDGMQRERVGRDGITRPARGLWTATTVRQLLLRERNAGLLVHNGVTLPESKIEAIITLDQHESLKGRIGAGTPVSERATTLLGGILRCECGAPMHGTISYSQRRGGPRHAYQHYKCSQALYDKSRRHASIVQSIVDELLTAWLWLDLFNGHLSAPGDDVTTALQGVSARLADNSEQLAHLGRVLLDTKLKRYHGNARADLQRLEAEREGLEAERDALLARAAEGGALAVFMEEWRRDMKGFSNSEEADAWHARLFTVWDGTPIERKQAMIRARYRPVIQVGGRGVTRVSPNPVDPATFAQPVEEEDEAV
jgi:DNA invertase Pin-like site-specific DNA recombinase